MERRKRVEFCGGKLTVLQEKLSYDNRLSSMLKEWYGQSEKLALRVREVKTVKTNERAVMDKISQS